jgi:hypothetical protein
MFLFAAEELKDTKFAKLSPVDEGGFAGELDRFEAADIGVDLPEAPLDRTLGNMNPEPMGGGLLAAALELDDQLSPFRSSMASWVESSQGVRKRWID